MQKVPKPTPNVRQSLRLIKTVLKNLAEIHSAQTNGFRQFSERLEWVWALFAYFKKIQNVPQKYSKLSENC
jgi:hypothetical protein